MVISYPHHVEEGVLGDKDDNALRTEIVRRKGGVCFNGAL